MARRRFQTGCLTKLGKRRKIWVIRWREDALDDHGAFCRVHRAETIGTVAELPNRRDALAKMEERLASGSESGQQKTGVVDDLRCVRRNAMKGTGAP